MTEFDDESDYRLGIDRRTKAFEKDTSESLGRIEEEDRPFSREQMIALKVLMHEAMDEYFASKGKTMTQWIILSAKIVASITVILVSMKFILAWLGFQYLK